MILATSANSTFWWEPTETGLCNPTESAIKQQSLFKGFLFLIFGRLPNNWNGCTIRIAASYEYPPFVIYNPNSTNSQTSIDRLEYRIIHEICKRMNISATYTEIFWNDPLATMLNKATDVLMGGVPIWSWFYPAFDVSSSYWLLLQNFISSFL